MNNRYACSICGTVIDWDGADDINGSVWSCEIVKCGKIFCHKCFADAHGEKAYYEMVQSGENVMCPSCYPKEGVVK